MKKKQDETVWLYEIQRKRYMSEAQKMHKRELRKANCTESVFSFSRTMRT